MVQYCLQRLFYVFKFTQKLQDFQQDAAKERKTLQNGTKEFLLYLQFPNM